jgi:hypothetical protein
MKTWKELRGEILRLGAQDESRYQADPMLFIEAINRATIVVCTALGEALPEDVEALAQDGLILPLSREAAAAVPLLAAFYVYEDEDERKAVRWREDAYDLIRRFAAQKRGRAEVFADSGTSI